MPIQAIDKVEDRRKTFSYMQDLKKYISRQPFSGSY